MSVYDYKVKAQDGSEVSLSDYAGKVLLIVNTATGCGFTPQYADLEAIYTKYKDQGFEILDFPCNQFGEQAPGSDEEIHSFCTTKFGTDFPQFSKIMVNGPAAEPLFVELSTAKPCVSEFGKGSNAIAMRQISKEVDKVFGEQSYIKWNFTKFLVDREGNVVARFEPTIAMADVEAAVAQAL